MRLKAGGRNDPVPAELGKVDGEWIAAAACLTGRLVAVEIDRRGRATPTTVSSPPTTPDLNLNVRLLRPHTHTHRQLDLHVNFRVKAGMSALPGGR